MANKIPELPLGVTFGASSERTIGSRSPTTIKTTMTRAPTKPRSTAAAGQRVEPSIHESDRWRKFRDRGEVKRSHWLFYCSNYCRYFLPTKQPTNERKFKPKCETSHPLWSHDALGAVAPASWPKPSPSARQLLVNQAGQCDETSGGKANLGVSRGFSHFNTRMRSPTQSWWPHWWQ